MRQIARDRGIDAILNLYNVDIIIGLSDSWLSTFSAAAGYPMATLPLGYLDYNGRAFGLSAIAKAGQEALLVKVMGLWEETFGPRQVPPMLRNGTLGKMAGPVPATS